MSWASVSPETAQKTCTTVAQIPHPANRLHVDNRFVAFEYSPLPFRAKCNEGPKSRRVVYNLVLNLIRGTGSRINSVMTKYFSVSPTIVCDTGRENYQGQTANALLNMNGKVTVKSLWIAVLLLPLWLTGSCETKLAVFYVKARNTEELKIHAFERCGRHYQVLSYEEDTARIECLEKIIEN